MESKATKEEDTGHWVPLTDPIGSCSNCTNNAACIAMRNHLVKCTQAKYRFKCPIEVFVSKDIEQVEHEEGDADGRN